MAAMALTERYAPKLHGVLSCCVISDKAQQPGDVARDEAVRPAMH